MSTESKRADSFWIAVTGVVTIFLAIWAVYTYYKPNDSSSGTAGASVAMVPPSEGIVPSSMGSRAPSETHAKHRGHTTHRHAQVTPITNAEVNAPEPNPSSATPSLNDWDLQQKAWCEQTLRIYESNPSFYGPGPVDELRGHHCDRWIGIPG